MNYLAESICLLNSSYSKDKIIKTFKSVLYKAGIHEFILLSNSVQVCTSPVMEGAKYLPLEFGNFIVNFQYKSLNNKIILTKKDIECLIVAFMVAIENSKIYKNLTDNIAFGLNKGYPTYDDLISDISKEIKHYERFETNFCVAKINFDSIILGEKYGFRISMYIDDVKNSIRATDSVYSDSKNIYVLFRNVNIDDGVLLLEKLRKVAKGNPIGIAEWKSTYVIVDLMSEIDNYIYLSQEQDDSSEISLVDSFNKVLNKSLYKREDVWIVKSSEVDNDDKDKLVLSFDIGELNYSVLINCKNKKQFTFLYEFSGDEIAEDILRTLENYTEISR